MPCASVAYFLRGALERHPYYGESMHITRIAKDGNSMRTSMPRPIFHALKLTPHDYLLWTWNSKGYAEIRALPKAEKLTRITDKK